MNRGILITVPDAYGAIVVDWEPTQDYIDSIIYCYKLGGRGKWGVAKNDGELDNLVLDLLLHGY